MIRLAIWAGENWHDIDGIGADTGIDPAALPPARFFNWLVRLMTKNRDETDLMKIEDWLDTPPKGMKGVARPGFEAEDEMAGFAAAAMATDMYGANQ